MLHGILGQLPQDMELRLFLTSGNRERAVNICLVEREDLKKEKKLELLGGITEKRLF